jgi:hypothetical protein
MRAARSPEAVRRGGGATDMTERRAGGSRGGRIRPRHGGKGH